MPTVSVIIPNYNHAPFLVERIESVLGQTHTDFELILMDDASKDDSVRVLERYADRPGVRLALNQQNSGSTFAQWNKGLAMAEGELVWLAESDDVADPQLLATLVGVLDANPTVTLAYCGSRVIDRHGEVLQAQYLPRHVPTPQAFEQDFIIDGHAEVSRHLSIENTVPNASAVVFRRKTFRAVGGADRSFRVCGDWKLWLDLALQGDVAFVAQPLNSFRTHPGTVRSNTKFVDGIMERYRLVALLRQAGMNNRQLDVAMEQLLAGWLQHAYTTRAPLAAARIFSRAIAVDPKLLQRMAGKARRAASRAANLG